MNVFNFYGGCLPCGLVPKKRLILGWKVSPVESKHPTDQNTNQHMPLALSITTDDKIKVSLNPSTNTNRPAKIQVGSAVWAVVSGPSTLAAAADGMSAYLISADEIGAEPTVYKVTTDADVGEGVEELADLITLTLTSPTAKNLGLVASAAEAKDVVPPVEPPVEPPVDPTDPTDPTDPAPTVAEALRQRALRGRQ